jgi:hypothetical protein
MTMNDTTKKLIKLLDNFPYKLSDYVGDNKYFIVDNHIVLAEYLTDNGVVVQKHGHWFGNPGVFGYECNQCGKWLVFERGNAEMNYCPNCGAKMN